MKPHPMIGYSMYARRLYHIVHSRKTDWAQCDATSMDFIFYDCQESELQGRASHLSRCVKCWPPAPGGTA